MQQEKLIREKIKEKVLDETGKKVRNIFFLCRGHRGLDNYNIYCVVGNNDNIFGVALVSDSFDVEVVV